MRIVVIGGTGRIGAQLVTRLRGGGHDVVAASPASGVNTVTGEGLAQALNGAAVVVDVSNSPSFDAEEVLRFFETSARNIVDASRVAGVGHLLVLSVVGTDLLLESPYFRAKLAQERVMSDGAVPYTIVRATQFFEFAAGIADAATDGNQVRLPSAFVQPIASADVAALLADLALSDPARGTVEIAGPDRLPLAEFVARSLRARGDPREVLVDPAARYFGARLAAETLTPRGEPRTGALRLDDHLRELRSTASPAAPRR